MTPACLGRNYTDHKAIYSVVITSRVHRFHRPLNIFNETIGDLCAFYTANKLSLHLYVLNLNFATTFRRKHDSRSTYGIVVASPSVITIVTILMKQEDFF